MNFGAAIRASRISRKLSQAELSQRIGVSRQAIGLLEGNAGRMSTLLAAQAHAPIQVSGLAVGRTLAERLRKSRGSRSILKVACNAGVSPNTVRALEKGGGTVGSFTKVAVTLAPSVKVRAVPMRRYGFKTVGGKRNNQRPIEDYYATPAPIARVLLDHEGFAGSILEPCVGEARVIEHVLFERGYSEVTCFDLQGEEGERRDFFDVTERYDAIVTNPPFNAHVRFIQHAKRVARQKIALLLPLNYLTGKQRHSQIWEDQVFPLARVYIFNRGVGFLSNDPFADRVPPTQLYCAWFVFERAHSGPPQLKWIDNDAFVYREGNSRQTA